MNSDECEVDGRIELVEEQAGGTGRICRCQSFWEQRWV